jgi:hypothetical protein
LLLISFSIPFVDYEDWFAFCISLEAWWMGELVNGREMREEGGVAQAEIPG